jgi:hypothetical protein
MVEHGRVCRMPFDAQFVEGEPSDRKLAGMYGALRPQLHYFGVWLPLLPGRSARKAMPFE